MAATTARPNRSPISHPTEMHEILITYSGPFHPLHSYSNLTHKTFCITLEQIISAESILNYLSQKTGWPSNILTLHSNSILFNPTHSICTHDTTIQVYPPLAATLSNSHTAILGGKGGFGTLLKGQSKQAGARQTLDFGACRDLSGRRLRHVNDEIKLRKFAALKKARERGEDVDELAALKTESGIRNWHLMVPNWSEGAFMSGKGRRKHERQLEREVRGWQSKEERARKAKEDKRMEEEWVVEEYVRRGEVEGARVRSGDVKEGILKELRRNKEEKLREKRGELDDVAAGKEAAASLAASEDLEEDNTSPSHLMTLSGEVSVYDTPNTKQQQSLRLHSQSDFATAVVLLDKSKLTSCKGIYIEYTIQSAGLAQIGWIRAPSNSESTFLPNSDTGDGVGDDAASYGYDGSRGLKFHDGEEVLYGDDCRWKSGDVLGCWCKFSDEKETTVQIGYTLNGSDLGVAFSSYIAAGSGFGFFPAVSANLGEVVDMNFGPDFSFQVQKGCIEACHLITNKVGCSDSDKETGIDSGADRTETAAPEEGTNSPPKKKPREAKTESDKPATDQSAITGNKVDFDLNSCKSVDDILAMDSVEIRNILRSMGVKCGGTPLERAERLFSLKGLKRQDYPKKVRGANFILES